VQALDLSKARACNRAMAVVLGAHVAELETDNTRLWTELEKARQSLVEANAARSSLSASQEELEWECTGLRAASMAFK
jgi:hypothetical protein